MDCCKQMLLLTLVVVLFLTTIRSHSKNYIRKKKFQAPALSFSFHVNRCPRVSASDPSSSENMANAASGMAVHDECKLKFLELKAKRTYRFIIYKIEEKLKQVIVEKLSEPVDSYEDFTANLPAEECRYAVYDFDFVTEENCQKRNA